MNEYHKIQGLFKRDEKTHKFIIGQYSVPEFEYLKDLDWVWTEKIDGTNIRVIWLPETKEVQFKGKTDNADISKPLLTKLSQIFIPDKFENFEAPICLYGEGYGNKIQKIGHKYIKDSVDFILFDVKICGNWQPRENVEKIAETFGIKVVPIVDRSSIFEAIHLVKSGLKSKFGDFDVEGLVGRPEYELLNRCGHRIITKIKWVDF